MAQDRAMTVMNGRALAFDRASVRTYDQEGRLHVAITHISKANVCPYRGDEIPGYEQLGLTAGRVYQLYRDPEELAKAAPTANNIQLLNDHVPVSVEAPQKKHVVGSTGTDARFEAPYLDNSLVIWDADAIRGIEGGEQRELSCAYRYTPDMTPGEADGVHYDGVMRDIKFNHVALVAEGRAGSDVLVGDQKEQQNMTKLSRKATVAKGALMAHLRPLLAQDHRIDVSPVLRGVTTSNWAARKPGIAKAMAKASRNRNHFAQDADLKALLQLLDGLDGEENEPDGDVGVDAESEAETPKIEQIAKKGEGEEVDSETDETPPPKTPKAAEDGEEDEEDGGEMDEDSLLNQLRALVAKLGGEAGQAEDEPPATPGTPAAPARSGGSNVAKEKPEMIDQKAMDAALKRHGDKVRNETIAQLNAIAAARDLVRPLVGELKGAFDSADAVLKFALDAAEVDLTGVPTAAYPALVKLLPRPGVGNDRPTNVVAMDAKSADSFDKMFGPDASRLKAV